MKEVGISSSRWPWAKEKTRFCRGGRAPQLPGSPGSPQAPAPRAVVLVSKSGEVPTLEERNEARDGRGDGR